MEAAQFKALPPLPREHEMQTTSVNRWKRAFGLVKAKARLSNVYHRNDFEEFPRAAPSLSHNDSEPLERATKDEGGTPTFDYAYHYDRDGCFHGDSSSSVLNETASRTGAYNEESMRKRQRRRLPVYRHSLTSGFLHPSFSGHNAKKEEVQANRKTIVSPPTAAPSPDQTATAVTEAVGAAAALTRQEKRQRKKEERAKRKELAGLTYAYAYGYGGLLQQRQQLERPGSHYFTHTQRESQLSSRLSLFSWEERNTEGEPENRLKEDENVHDCAARGECIRDEQKHEHTKHGRKQEHEPDGSAHQHDLDDCDQSEQGDEHGHHSTHETSKDLSRQWKPIFRSRSLREKSVRKPAISRSRSLARETRLRRQSKTSVHAQKQSETSDYQGPEDRTLGGDAERQLPTEGKDKQTGQPLHGPESKDVNNHTVASSEGRSGDDAEHTQDVAPPHGQKGFFGLGIILDNDNCLPSTLADSGLAGSSIKRSPSQSKTTLMPANLSRQRSQSQVQAPKFDSSTGMSPASLPIITDKSKEDRKTREFGLCSTCIPSDCGSAVEMYQHGYRYPPVPRRHPDHRPVAAVKSAMSSPHRGSPQSTVTSASVLNVTTPPTTRESNFGQPRNKGPSIADDADRDPKSASPDHRHGFTGTDASAELVIGPVTAAAKSAICKQHKGQSDSWQLVHEIDQVNDNGDDTKKRISPVHPCKQSQERAELHLPSHEASRSSRSCSACRPGTSVAVIQQHKKHERQHCCPDGFKADVACQLEETCLANSIADAERLRVSEFPDVAIQQRDSRQKLTQEDNGSSRYNHGSGHPYNSGSDHSRRQVQRSRSVPPTGRSETEKHGDSIPSYSIALRNKICSQTSLLGNIRNCRERSEPVTSGSGRADTMITTTFDSDRNPYLRTSNPSLKASHYSRDTRDCTGAEAASVQYFGCIYDQHDRENSHDYLRGNTRQSMEDVRFKPLRSHPVQSGTSTRPLTPRAASCSSFLSTKPKNSRSIYIQAATDIRRQRNHGPGEKSSLLHVRSPASTQLYNQQLSPIVRSDEKTIDSQPSSPFKAPVPHCRLDGKKLKKSVSMSPLLSGEGLREMGRVKRLGDETSSPQSLPYSSKAPQERWQSTDCLVMAPWSSAQKRMKDLHRKASVSPLKINFLGETMGEVPVPIYPGSASSRSSHLYYSCNEEATPDESVVTLQSYGKDSGDCILTPLSRHSPLIPEYESSSDPPTSDEDDIEIKDVKIESAQRVSHRRVDAVEIKQIDIKPKQASRPSSKPSQTAGSPVFRLLPDNIPRRRIKQRNIEALNRFLPRRTASEPSHSPTSVSEKERLSHSTSFTNISKRPALRRAEPYVRQCHSLPASNMNSPTFHRMPEEEIATMRDRMQSSSSTSSNQSSWSQSSNASEHSLRTFVDLKDASFVFS